MSRPAQLLARVLAPIADPRRLTAAVALAFAVGSVGLLAGPPAALAWGTGDYSSSSESQLISLQNQARASAGRKSLKLDTALRSIARWRSKDMVERDYFSHTIKGTSHNVFWYMQHEYGYCFKVAGENIGTVTWEGASVEDATNWVFNAFMESEGHRDNIMGKAWDVVAVGAYKGPGDRFMWTVLFADRCGSGSPDPTAKPKPDPTPKPDRTPRPTAKPDRTPRPTAKPERTPKPTPTPEPIVASTPEPTPSLEAPATPRAGADSTRRPDPDPSPADVGAAAGDLRVIDQPADISLVDSILESVTARYFGR